MSAGTQTTQTPEREATRAESFALMEAWEHEPDKERGGCSCGFVIWSVEHVVLMAARAIERQFSLKATEVNDA